MASSPVLKFSLLLLFSLLSYPQTQARDSQLFNKVSASDPGAAATTAVPNQDPPLNNNQQDQDQPRFFHPENENGYGLYGHESGQLPRSATGAAAESEDHLPRNYNPVAYLTEPEEDTEDSDPDTGDSYTTTLRKYFMDAQKRNRNQQEDEETREPEQYRSYYNNYRYGGGSSFNSEPQGMSGNSRDNYLYNDGEESRFRPQGMSDTRSLENGKYFYDIKTEKYGGNHPYAVLKRAGANDNYNERSYGGANENSMSESYQKQYEFQNEGNVP